MHLKFGSIFVILLTLIPILGVTAHSQTAVKGTYVSMGSSYAAGPGILPYADNPPNRCTRSRLNYAHQLAQRLNLALVDVSCSGATTTNILKPWRELPAQVDAVNEQTQLVTITIGGNDLNYAANLVATSCRYIESTKSSSGSSRCPAVKVPTETDYRDLGYALASIVREVRLRSPKAVIIFVEYPTALPDGPLCNMTPMSDDEAKSLRGIASRLALITEDVAKTEKVEVIEFAKISRTHDACAALPWMNGFFDGAGRITIPYHPNLAGMTAMANSLSEVVERKLP